MGTHRPAVRAGVLLLALALTACGDDAGELPEGQYSIQLEVLADPGTTPGWALSRPRIDFTLEDGVVTVTSSSLSYLARGEVRFAQDLGSAWNIHFHLDPFAFAGAENEYFFATVERRGCYDAGARDNSRNETYPASCELLAAP